MVTTRLPEFIIIGAAKAATTWIARRLRERPDVFMPGPEPHFFSREYRRGRRWYLSWFEAARQDQMIGEKSADYLADPFSAARIAEMLPNVRLIAQLRNPVERAYSHYCMFYRRGQVGDDVDRYLDRRRTPAPLFLDDGLYAEHLKRFLDHFPRQNMKIILYDEIRSDPRGVLAEVTDLLGLPQTELRPEAYQPINDGSAALLPLAMRRLPQPLKKLAEPLRGNSAFERMRALLARPIRYPPLSETVRLRLQDFYQQDVERLGAIVGRDLTEWGYTREA